MSDYVINIISFYIGSCTINHRIAPILFDDSNSVGLSTDLCLSIFSLLATYRRFAWFNQMIGVFVSTSPSYYHSLPELFNRPLIV